MEQGLPFGWTEHVNRGTIHDETHARPSAPMSGAGFVRRAAFLSRDRGRDLQPLQASMQALAGLEKGQARFARQFSFRRGDVDVTWEMHNEFATLTWRSAERPASAWPEGIGLEAHAALDFVAAMEVEVLMAAHMPPERLTPMASPSLCYASLYEGQVEVATDFVADENRMVHFILAAANCGDRRRGVIVRRLLEIETYRSLALLGLPVARQLSGRVQVLEHDLSKITREIGDPGAVDIQRQGLDSLHRLSVEAGRQVEDTGFRLAATQAYGDILANRLERLGERSLGESTTITRYLDNRIRPALATCRAAEKRLGELGGRVQRSIELLNATMSVAIQSQNQAVLDTILRTAVSTYRLQETVEGLSIIAMTYYGLGILGYVFEAFHDELPLAKPVMMTLAAPIVALLVFVLVRRLRRHKGASKNGSH